MLLEAKNTATQNTGVSSGPATAEQPGTAEQQNPATPAVSVPRPRSEPFPRQTKRAAAEPKRRRTGNSTKRPENRPRFNPARTLAQAGLLTGIVGACVLMTMVIWSGNASAPIHLLVNIPVLVAGVSHHYLRSHRPNSSVSLEHENRPTTAMRYRSYRRNRERTRDEHRRNRQRV
ncbi:hypothetical protein GCM10023335_75620 [Streptomyces siamensis]|uniref:DUF3043 domain-containing protein n=2 Tax=Streptomyces siamensis TaxID=1274986 RepID=A0ABP9JK57_9ACTN